MDPKNASYCINVIFSFLSKKEFVSKIDDGINDENDMLLE